MSSKELSIFFYGLFMDESLLAAKGVRATGPAIGYVKGYRLLIGERATLIPEPDGLAYGVLMKIAPEDVADLYSDRSVADYVAETLIVTLPGGIQEPAVCFNLPVGKSTGTNPKYAAALLELATGLGLPEAYLEEIRAAGHG